MGIERKKKRRNGEEWGQKRGGTGECSGNNALVVGG